MTGNKYFDAACAIGVGLYVILSAIGAATPASKIGQFCTRWAAKIRDIDPQVNGGAK